MSDPTPIPPAPKNSDSEDRWFYTFLLAIVCIPLAGWLIYCGYQKNQQAPIKMSACEKKCLSQGHAGYEFKWPILGGPQCTCIDMK